MGWLPRMCFNRLLSMSGSGWCVVVVPRVVFLLLCWRVMAVTSMHIVSVLSRISVAVLRMCIVAMSRVIVMAMCIMRLIELLGLVPLMLFTGRKTYEN